MITQPTMMIKDSKQEGNDWILDYSCSIWDPFL